MKLTGFRLLWPDVTGCHLTAARIYGLPLPNRLRDHRLHVASTDQNIKIKRANVKLHRHKALRYTEIFDLSLVSVPDLFFELAPLLSDEELITLGDAVVGKQNSGPLTSIRHLRREAERQTYLRARSRVEKALTLIRETVESPRETWLRLWFLANGFPEPVVHPTVLCCLNNRTLHPDLGYPEFKLAIEYEGDHHRTSEMQFGNDIERRQLLEAEGWTVLRVSKRTNMTTFKRIVASYFA